MPSQEGRDRVSGSSRIDPARVSLLAILTLAVVARLYGVDELDVWIDEANAILTAGEALPQMLDKLKLDSSPPFFYVLLHSWILIFGDGSIALRLLSGFVGVALVASTYWAGKELISRPVGLWAALFVAASPIQAFYSQQVRMYALLPLLALLSVALLVRYLRDERRGDYALWLAFTILALYTHNFAIYLLPVHAVLIALSGRLVRSWGRWAFAAAVVSVAYAPWIPILAVQLENRDHYAWFLEDWRDLGPSGIVARTFRSYSPGAEYAKFGGLDKFTTWGGWPSLVMAGLAGLGAWSLALRWRLRGLVEALWPGIFLLVPIAGALVGSFLLTPHYVPSRVDQMMFPAFALLVGLGLGRLRPRSLRLAMVVTILAVAAWSKLNLYSDDPTWGVLVVGGVRRPVPLEGSDRDLAVRIAERWRPEDVILSTSLSRAPLQYYLGRMGVEARFVSFPRGTALHLGSQNDEGLLADPPALAREADAAVGQARAMASPEGRVFLIRVLSRVNGILMLDSMDSRFGFQRLEYLGLFKQTGTHKLVEVAVYRSVQR